MTNSGFQLSVACSTKQMEITLDQGEVLFIVGSNGAGKSALMHDFYSCFSGVSKRILAQRRTWIPSSNCSLNNSQIVDSENAVNKSYRDHKSRYRNDHGGSASQIVLREYLNSENNRSREITKHMDNNDLNTAQALTSNESISKKLNRLFKLAHIPIEISISNIEQFLASKNGGPTFGIDRLSDGERNALFMVLDVLTAKTNTLLLIDEPERHLHRSITSPLLSSLFLERSDCVFVVSTHDIQLPIDNSDSKTLLVRNCSWQGEKVQSWDVDLFDDNKNINDEIKASILGSKRKILFIEGNDSGSLDKYLYQILFPDVSVIAKGDCREVIKVTEGLSSISEHHWVNAYGLIDKDDRPMAEIESLKQKRIITTDCYAIEALYYCTESIRAVCEKYAKIQGSDSNDLESKAIKDIIKDIKKVKLTMVSQLVERQIRKNIFEQIPNQREIQEISNKSISIDIKAFMEKESKVFDDFVSQGQINALIQRYPIKKSGVIFGICRNIGVSRSTYENILRQEILENTSFKKRILMKFVDLEALLKED